MSTSSPNPLPATSPTITTSTSTSTRQTTSPENPLITILGATGTGKSALAVSLARRFNGEIINADAMQMYRGLPIITNKIRAEEQEGVRHHVLDSIGLEERPWTVTRFVATAKREIEEIRRRGKVPIVVGGTGYYVHGLVMRRALLGETEEEEKESKNEKEDNKGGHGGSSGMPVEEMYAKLQELDPEMAKTWHPRDKRRIERSLEICLKTGRKASELYKEQQLAKEEMMAMDTNGGDGQEGLSGLQYDTLLLWLEAEDEVLKERLDSRVDAMVRNGLFEEVLELYKEEQRFQRENIAIDKTKGIWQSIGYKELELWATKANQDADDHDSAHPSPSTSISKLATNGIEGVKAGTRQYAKRQNRYIRNRFASALRQAGALERLFLIDSTDISRWSETVVPQSEKLVSAFLEGRQLPDAATLSDLASTTFARIVKHDNWRSNRVAHYCEACKKTLMGDREWEGHMKSRSHKNVTKSHRKKPEKIPFRARKAALAGTEKAESRLP